MAFRFDFAAVDPLGQTSLLVEVKNNLGTDREWARQLHALIARWSDALGASGFLLVTPDRIYAWPPTDDERAEPTVVLDAAPILRPYFERIGADASLPVDRDVFEDLVRWWLEDLAHGIDASSETSSALAPVVAAIRGTTVVAERAA